MSLWCERFLLRNCRLGCYRRFVGVCLEVIVRYCTVVEIVCVGGSGFVCTRFLMFLGPDIRR